MPSYHVLRLQYSVLIMNSRFEIILPLIVLMFLRTFFAIDIVRRPNFFECTFVDSYFPEIDHSWILLTGHNI